jgi:hypothetical protein
LKGFLVAIVAAAFVATAPSAFAAQATSTHVSRGTAELTMNVIFDYQGNINVALPDGTPVGARSGTPPVIPAGYYSVILTGPGSCTLVPYFLLSGPGVAVSDNMAQGEEDFTEYVVDFLPNSTYTWKNGDNPSVVYTFRTSGDVVGTKAPPVVWKGPVTSKSSNKDIVGSGLLPTRGSLTAAIDGSGKLTLQYKGKKVASIPSGRYKVAITDGSATGGLWVQPGKRKAVVLTTAAFVGKKAVTLNLTAGTWKLATAPGRAAGTIVVR